MTDDKQLVSGECLALIERASRGVVPCDLAVCTSLLDACGKIEGAARVVRWIALAQARQCPEFRAAESGGRGKKSPWLEWAREHYPEYESEDHIRQMAQVGAFLVRCRASLNSGTCPGVYALDFEKLRMLARLPENLIGPYLERYEVTALSRDQVRASVNSFLRAAGLPGGEVDGGGRSGQSGRSGKKPEQMDFLDTLFGVVEKTIDDETHRKLVENPRVKALDSAITGLHLVGVAVEKWSVADKIDETMLEETIDELDKLRASLLERLAQHGPLALEA